jgi:DNA-binding response OmpR family regulator
MTPVDVLLVEDSAGDALLAIEVLSEFPMPVKVHIARDGTQALQMLERGTFLPSLVLLDLDIPKVSGLEVLEQYRSRSIPIVVLSASSRETDKCLAIELGASEYIQKPTDLQAFRDTLWGILERWVSWKPSGTPNEASSA